MNPPTRRITISPAGGSLPLNSDVAAAWQHRPWAAVTESPGKHIRSVARQDWVPPLLYLILDCAVWAALYAGISYVRGDAFFTTPSQFLLVDVVQLAVIVQALFIVGAYNRYTDARTLSYTAEHILALVAAAGISSLLLYSAATYDQTMKPSRGVLLLCFLLFIPISLAYRRVVSRFVAASISAKAFLVIGTGKLAEQFYNTYRRAGTRQRLEFVDIRKERSGEPIAGPGSPIIDGDLESKLNNLTRHYSGVILAEDIARFAPDLLARLVRTQFQSTRVYTLESFYETHWGKVPLHALDAFWPLQSGFQLARLSPYYYVKRLFDVVASTIGLLLAAPLCLVISASIAATSGRPLFYRQQRVGRDEALFTIYKFRTMVERPEDDTDDIYTRKGDPRVTPLGRWLRKLRLDELPQLWNVFRGDMTLIGPRAEWVRCAERYRAAIPLYHFRHLIKPGITGWAQVNYPYGESDADAFEKLKYDLYYIRHYSLRLDAMIFLKTIYTMLFWKGR
jgi:exopolysaccharide biosynthesis polyprenyl glycosylphosphotransferase